MALLDRKYPEELYTILPNHTIRLSNPQQDVEDYSRLAAEQNVLITGLERHQHSLEDYYMNLKGVQNHA